MLTTIKYLLTYLFLIFAFAFLYCHLGFASQHHFFISQNTQVEEAVGGFSDPSDISDLIAWYDATDVLPGSEPSDNDKVPTWNDLSASGYDLLQTTSSKQPSYNTNIQNSKPKLNSIQLQTTKYPQSTN